MSFLSSWRLILLAGPALLLVAYLVAQRARQKAAVRFSSVDLLSSVAPRRPGWQRHIPAGALIAALVLLVIAFAQPTRTTRTPRQRATVILTLDVSGSMASTDVSPSRLAAAQEQAKQFVNELPPGVQLGLIAFSNSASVLVPPTSDRSTMLAAIGTLQAGGGTATADAIYLGLNAISTIPPGVDGKKAPAAIVLMSDGAPTIGHGTQSPLDSVTSASAAAKAAGVKINTIAYGTEEGTVNVQGQDVPVPADPNTMAQIASQTGGQSFTASTAQQLKSVYNQIGRLVGYDVHHQEITAWFTGLALLLAMAAAVSALIWSQRIT